MSDIIRDVLIETKSIIDTPDKWGKFDGEGLNGKMCLYLAVYDACYAHSGSVMDTISALGFNKLHEVDKFNDHPDTSYEDVINLIDDTISECRE